MLHELSSIIPLTRQFSIGGTEVKRVTRRHTWRNITFWTLPLAVKKRTAVVLILVQTQLKFEIWRVRNSNPIFYFSYFILIFQEWSEWNSGYPQALPSFSTLRQNFLQVSLARGWEYGIPFPNNGIQKFGQKNLKSRRKHVQTHSQTKQVPFASHLFRLVRNRRPINTMSGMSACFDGFIMDWSVFKVKKSNFSKSSVWAPYFKGRFCDLSIFGLRLMMYKRWRV